jgi:hypothetical protein
MGWVVAVLIAAPLALCVAAFADTGQVQTVFVIAMENHNWTQPSSETSPGQIFGSPYAPYINSLVTPATRMPPRSLMQATIGTQDPASTRQNRTTSRRKPARTSGCSTTTTLTPPMCRIHPIA